eukprot:TRINITY_DN486_c0_g1_i9.p1 TRINITY_DN486_c0_g1~~TRINITY_DN486_c0_g1_i9.p1  ORF type:complete len:408 (+),score=66.76 TRINITY_DN486_c0_g1_i9:696-1919(+)
MRCRAEGLGNPLCAVPDPCWNLRSNSSTCSYSTNICYLDSSYDAVCDWNPCTSSSGSICPWGSLCKVNPTGDYYCVDLEPCGKLSCAWNETCAFDGSNQAKCISKRDPCEYCPLDYCEFNYETGQGDMMCDHAAPWGIDLCTFEGGCPLDAPCRNGEAGFPLCAARDPCWNVTCDAGKYCTLDYASGTVCLDGPCLHTTCAPNEFCMDTRVRGLDLFARCVVNPHWTAVPTQSPQVNSTEAPGVNATEGPGVNTTEAPGVNATEAPGVNATEAPGTQPATNTTDAGPSVTEAPETQSPEVNATEAPTTEASTTKAPGTTDAPGGRGTQEPTEAPENSSSNNFLLAILLVLGGVVLLCGAVGGFLRWKKVKSETLTADELLVYGMDKDIESEMQQDLVINKDATYSAA